MKLAHLSDLHLGFRQFNRQTPQGINQREADVAQAFRRAADDVIEAAPDVVLVAGDIFHSVRPSNPAILDSFNQFRRLRDALPGTPIVIIAGNHDTPRAAETGSILRLFEAIGSVHVITHEPRCIRFEDFDLAITGIPHSAILAAGGAPKIAPDRGMKWNVRMQHSEIAGVVPGDRSDPTYGGIVVEPGDLQAELWSYVALGHYHVARQVWPNAWFSGSLDYVSHNPWGELRESPPNAAPGAKGWLLVTLTDQGPEVEFRPVELSRRHIDLEPVYAAGMTAAEINDALSERIEAVRGSIDEQVVRQVVYDVPRTVGRDLDHEFIRAIKSRALHYRLDVRRPTPVRAVGLETSGKRQTLPELVNEYLSKRPLPADVDRDELIGLAREYLGGVEKDLSEN